MGRPASASPAFTAFVFLLLVGLLRTVVGYAESVPGDLSKQCLVTIQSVHLKNSEGQWIKIIEPDRQIDVVKEEPGLSFFNNGRVPDGEYVNFKLTVLKEGTMELFSPEDLRKPLIVKRGSFVGVWFSLDPKEPTRILGLSVTVDQDTRSLANEELRVQRTSETGLAAV